MFQGDSTEEGRGAVGESARSSETACPRLDPAFSLRGRVASMAGNEGPSLFSEARTSLIGGVPPGGCFAIPATDPAPAWPAPSVRGGSSESAGVFPRPFLAVHRGSGSGPAPSNTGSTKARAFGPVGNGNPACRRRHPRTNPTGAGPNHCDDSNGGVRQADREGFEYRAEERQLDCFTSQSVIAETRRVMRQRSVAAGRKNLI